MKLLWDPSMVKTEMKEPDGLASKINDELSIQYKCVQLQYCITTANKSKAVIPGVTITPIINISVPL